MVAYFDGLCEPNPSGHACGGWVVEGREDLAGGEYLGHGSGCTNNAAEYQAALSVLRRIYRTGWRGPVVLRGDSQLVVRQYTGEYGCNAEGLIPLLAQLRKAATFFSALTLEWVTREENEAADQQSRRAYKDQTGREAPVRGARR